MAQPFAPVRAVVACALGLAGAACAATAAGAQPSPAAAPGCTSFVTRAGLADHSGARIRSVRVVTHPPRPFRGPARLLNGLHKRTTVPTVRRELLFAAGDTVDSLRIAESLRRLRGVGFLQDVWLTATRCPAPGGAVPAPHADTTTRAGAGAESVVDLLVETRDAWSTTAEAYATPAQQTLGAHEANLFGTGRTVSVVLRRDADRLGDRYRMGVSASLGDPALTPHVAAGVGVAVFADGYGWAVAAGSRRRAIADRWTARASLSQSVRNPEDLTAERARRDRAELLVGRRLSAEAATAAVYLLGGAFAARTTVESAVGALVVGPDTVRRSYAGPELGIALRALRFDTLTWVLPRGGIADVPRGTESELVVGVGRDAAVGSAAMRLDAWTGRVWRPGARSLLATDAWASGYANRAAGQIEAGSLRGAATALRAARNGLWTARLGGERLVRPDPDVRAYFGFDRTAVLLPGVIRLAGASAAASIERSVHLRAITQSLVLDAAAFGAASRRWRPASDAAGDAVTVALVGVGLHAVPTREGQPTVGLELGYPVVRPAVVRAQPVLQLLIAPWFGSGRGR